MREATHVEFLSQAQQAMVENISKDIDMDAVGEGRRGEGRRAQLHTNNNDENITEDIDMGAVGEGRRGEGQFGEGRLGEGRHEDDDGDGRLAQLRNNSNDSNDMQQQTFCGL